MKIKEKERSKSKGKIVSKKMNNNNEKTINNPFLPIKYLCFNEVKKIINNKNKKSPVTAKINERHKNINRVDKLKKEEEDDYSQQVYNKKLFIPYNASFSKKLNINIFNNNNKTDKNKNLKICLSSDERYKSIKKFGFYTKTIFCGTKIIYKNIKGPFTIKKNKFSKKNGLKKKFKNKIKFSNNNHIDIHEITNANNIIYRINNINDSNNTITTNTITSKTITNNTMSNYTMSNVTHNSNQNKSINSNNNPKMTRNMTKAKDLSAKIQLNKINNIKVIKNKGRNKNINNLNNKNLIRNIRNKINKNNEYENTVFVRRIVLEEKFTIDSKGDKKTIYIKKISPIIKEKEIINSADKRLNKKKTSKNKDNKSNNFNNKDSTYINHNDINLNFNVCSFQKINLNNSSKKNNLYSLNSKIDSFDEDNKSIRVNNENSLNDTILQNYKDFLNLKHCKQIIYQKPNGILYKYENNHKSYQSLFSSPNKKYLMQLSESNCEKKKNIFLNNNHAANINLNKINSIILNNKNKHKKRSNKDFKYNSPLKYIPTYPRCLKNKMVHRKTKTNFILSNDIEKEKLNLEDDNDTLSNKRSLSFVGKMRIYNMMQKMKDGKKIETKEKLKNINLMSPQGSPPIPEKKINDYLHFSTSNTAMNSKNNSKIVSIKSNNCSGNMKKFKDFNKINICRNNNNDSIDINSRCHSLNKLKEKTNFNTNDIKLLVNYLKNNMIASEINKSHRNFLIKKCEKFNFNNLIKRKKNNNSTNNSKRNKINCSNIIYLKTKPTEKIIKNKK